MFMRARVNPMRVMTQQEKENKVTRAIKVGTSPQGDEELRAVGVRATIGHTQQPVIGGGQAKIFKMQFAKSGCAGEPTLRNPVDG